MNGYSILESRNVMMGGKIVIETMTKILFNQLSNAEEAPSKHGLPSEVVR
jgi:hypothetical protein